MVALISVTWLPLPALLAQINARLTVHRSGQTGLVTFVQAPSGGIIPVEPRGGRTRPDPADFFVQHGHLFGVTDPQRQLQRGATTADDIGHSHTTFQQVHRGIPVFSGILRVHQNQRGEVVAANGDFHQLKPAPSTVPRITGEEAVRLAKVEVGMATADLRRARLVIVDPGWYGDPPIGARLAYHVELRERSTPMHEALFVDAHSGEILDRWSLIYDAKDRAIHDTLSSSDCCFDHVSAGCDEFACQAIVCDDHPECCSKEWSTRCAIGAAIDCETLCIPGEVVRTEDEPPVSITDADAAYDYLGDVYDYFSLAFARDSYDDAGATLTATVRWPFNCPNAYWDDVERRAFFCEGVATDDIVGHELMHAVTVATADLIYQNQPGQLNESFSDVFGELVDLFNGGAELPGLVDGSPWTAHDTGAGEDSPNLQRSRCSTIEDGYSDGVRWLIGEDAAGFGGAIRDMWDPTCLGDPDRAGSELQTCDAFDAGGVHSGSGIPNHAFVLATDGGAFNGYTIRGIGAVKAAAVWYRALTVYLTVASDFRSAFAAFNQAAQDLIGTFPLDPRTGLPSSDLLSGSDALQVFTALKAVEMDTVGRCGQTTPVLSSEPPRQCVDPHILFADDFEGGAGQWSVSNSGPPTPYDWTRRNELPFEREGTAWYVADPSGGDCEAEDESAIHSLISPPIVLPSDAQFPYLAFTHYMESEPGYDGGRVMIRVNGEEWQVVPATAFELNPYNSLLRPLEGTQNTNPLAGEAGWTGLGGQWGVSVAALGGLASEGDSIELRFDFGKDRCAGFDGWYVDDVTVYNCADCNLNDVPDHQEFYRTAASGPVGGFSLGSFEGFVVSPAPEAVSYVKITVHAVGDFSGENEYLDILFNLTRVAQVLTLGGSDCSATPIAGTVFVPAKVFNEARRDGGITIRLRPSDQVNGTLCRGGSLAGVFLEYPLAPNDEDGDGVLDVCQNCARAQQPRHVPWPPLEKNRYLSLRSLDAGRLTALRVIANDMPRGLREFEGMAWWVGQPELVNATLGSAAVAGDSFHVAPLTCEPVFLDWGKLGALNVFGDAIVPGAEYVVQAVDLACGLTAEADYSSSLPLRTSRWGDVVGHCNEHPCTPPDGQVDVIDVLAVLLHIAHVDTAVSAIRVDVAGPSPDQIVDLDDAYAVLDAFLRTGHPPGPHSGCGEGVSPEQSLLRVDQLPRILP